MAHPVQPWFQSKSALRRGMRRARPETLLGLEPLESRELLTIFASVDAMTNVLTISTDNAADALTLQSSGSTLLLGGTSEGSPYSNSFGLGAFTSLKIDDSSGQRFSSVDMQGVDLSAQAVDVDANAVSFTTGAVFVASLGVNSLNDISQDTAAGIKSTGAVTFNANNNVYLNGTLTATGQTVTLSGSNVLQDDKNSSIVAANLEGVAVGNFNLASKSNAVSVVAGSTSIGIFRFYNSQSLSIGTVGGSVGIDSKSDAEVLVTGTGNTLTVNKLVTSQADVALTSDGTLTVSASVTGTNVLLKSSGAQVSQTGGTITATRLEIGAATGAVLTQTNAFDKIAGEITGTGDFEVRSNKGTGFSVVDETGGGSSFAGITTNNGNVTLRTIGSGKTITVSAPITAGGTGNTVLLKADGFNFDGTKAITATNAVVETVGPSAGLDLGVGTLMDSNLNAFNVENLNFRTNGAVTVSAALDLSADVSNVLQFQTNKVNLQASVTANSAGVLRLAANDVTLNSAAKFSAKAIEFAASNDITFTNSAVAGGLDFSQTDLNTFDETTVDTVRFSSLFGTISFTNGAIAFDNGQVMKAGGSVVLKSSSGAVSQTGGTVSADDLAVFGTSVSLQGANSVDVLAGSATGNFLFTNTGDLSIGSVDVASVSNTRGIGTAGVSAPLVRIESGGALSQTSAGVLQADALAAVGNSVDLTAAANVANTAGGVLTLAGEAKTGDFQFSAAEAGGLKIGTVDTGVPAEKVAGVTVDTTGKFAGLTNTQGKVSQDAAGVGDLTADNAVVVGTSVDLSTATNTAKTTATATAMTIAGEATAGDFKFYSADADGLSIGTVDGTAGVKVDAAGGFAHFKNTNAAGKLTQAAGAAGAVTADLVAAEGASVDLTAGTNASATATPGTVQTLAGRATLGSFKYTSTDADGLTVGTVDGVLGVTVDGAGQFLQLVDTVGAISQAATSAGAITADFLAVQGQSVDLTAGTNAAKTAGTPLTIAGTTTTGDFAFSSGETDGVTVGSVDVDGDGLPAGNLNGVTSPNAVNVTVTATGGPLVAAQSIQSSTAGVTLASAALTASGSTFTQSGGTIAAADVDVSANGAVSQAAAGTIVTPDLTMTSSNGSIDLAGTTTLGTGSATFNANTTLSIALGGLVDIDDGTANFISGGATTIDGTVDLGLATGNFNATGGATVDPTGVLGFTVNTISDHGQAKFNAAVTINGTIATNFLNTDVLFLSQAITPGFQLIPTDVSVFGSPKLGFLFNGAPSEILIPNGLTPTVLINDVVLTFLGSTNDVGKGFNLSVFNPPVSIASVFVLQQTVLTVPAVALVVAPVVLNTLPAVEQDEAYGQQTNLAGLTVFVKLFTVVGGKKVWVLGGLKSDKDGNLVEVGDSLKGTEVLPKLIAVFTDTISGKWGDYTLELEEMAPEAADGDVPAKATRTVRATFKFNVKTQQQLIEALRNIQTIEKLFQYFQELPSRSATPVGPSTTGGADRVDPRRSPAARLASISPAAFDASLAGWASTEEAVNVVEVSPDVILTPPAGVQGAAESVFVLTPAAEAEGDGEADAASDFPTVAGAAIASAATAVGLFGRRRGDERFEQDLDAMMEAFDELRARWN